VLDHHSSHTAAASLRLARELGIELVWLPKQCPNLNPVEHLWRELKGRLAANRQFETIEEELREAEAWTQHLTLQETFRKAGLCSPTFWLHKLHKLYKNIRDPT
jgi:transposase